MSGADGIASGGARSNRGATLLSLSVLFLLAAPSAHALAEPGDGWSENLARPLQLFRQFFGDAEPIRVVQDHLVAISSGTSALTFELKDGGSLRMALAGGEVLVDDHSVAHYPSGGALEAAWRQLVLESSRRETGAAVAAVHAWHPDRLSHEEESAAGLLRERFATLSAPGDALALPQAVEQAEPGGLTIDLSDLSDPARLEPALRQAAALRGENLRITVPHGRARVGNFSIGSGENLPGHLLVLRGNADVYGTLEGNLATVDGDIIVHPGAVVTGDVLAVAGDVRDAGGEIRGEIRTLRPAAAAAVPTAPTSPPPSAWALAVRHAAGLVGVFATLLVLGFGLVLFGKQPLEVVSDTVAHSFGRAFLVGLIGQILVIPTFGMLVVGLILSVAGILLLPFAVIVYCLLVIVALVGGFLAVAHAMGETHTRRRFAVGAMGSPNSYRYVALGLIGSLALWAAWVLFGWVPVAGTLIFGAALLGTWLLATVGFGAALLSRAGLREQFAGRLIPAEALTDEYLWATPQYGVPAVRRPGSRTPPPRG